MTPRRQDVRSPRFVVRVLTASFATVALVLGAVFTVLILHTRALVERNVVDNLRGGQRQLALLERERQQSAALQARVITENSSLKAALDVYQGEIALARDENAEALVLQTVQNEVDKIAAVLSFDVVAVVGVSGQVVVSAGPASATWPRGAELHLSANARDAVDETIVRRGDRIFRATVAPVRFEGDAIGALILGRTIDAGYVAQLSRIAGTSVAVSLDHALVATTLPEPRHGEFVTALRHGLSNEGSITMAGERHAYLRLQRVGRASFYAIDSVSAATAVVSKAALPKLAGIALGGLALCLLASLRLARAVSAPIDTLSREIAAMADAHTTARLASSPRSSREIETLGATFDRLVHSLQEARAETDAAYLGAIRALAAALDARDAYTAGHSERVSAVSVAIGKQMKLEEAELEILRLGALLHDIGKIGISDAILAKAGTLTDEEFEVIKGHPMLGAQILRTVAFLEPHLPIVELHHEQPDGHGYPYGLQGEQIPVLARIVHVADAFDAMTTARAYRDGRPPAEALTELWRYAGTQFDLASVQGLSAALPDLLSSLPGSETGSPKLSDVRPFRRRA
jgi:putative nucleotidyltransferase with HDIG domain